MAELGRALEAACQMDEPARAAVLDAALATAGYAGRATLGGADLVRAVALAFGLPSPLSSPVLTALAAPCDGD